MHLDPVSLWCNVDQPVLAVYGNEDKSVPPAESAGIPQEALREGGNQDHTVLSFPDADHSLLVSRDGYDHPPGRFRYVPGYVEAMTGWILGQTGTSASSGAYSQADVNRPTRMPQSETPTLDPSRVPWYGTAGVQVGLVAAFVLAYVSAVATESARALRRRVGDLPKMPTTASFARLLTTAVSALDLVVLVGFAAMVAEVIRVNGLGPPPLWTLLQALGLLAVVLTLALLVATAVTGSKGIGAPLTAQVGHLLVVLTAVLFDPFMLYWNLVYPGF